MKNFKVFKSGYRFNRRLGSFFFGAMFLLILPQLVWSLNEGFFGDGWVSVSCESDSSIAGYCVNPVLGKCALVNYDFVCFREFLPVGFVYNPLPWFYDLYHLPVLFLFASFVLINHFKYNRDWRFSK